MTEIYSDERRVYELGYHIVSTLDESKVAKTIDSLRDTIIKLGGELILEGEAELIDLAYTMVINNGGKHTKYDKAYFGWIKFDMEPEKMVDFKEKTLEADKNVLRYLLFKTVREDTRAPEPEVTLKEVKNDGVLEVPKGSDEKKNNEKKKVSEKELDKTLNALEAEEESSTK